MDAADRKREADEDEEMETRGGHAAAEDEMVMSIGEITTQLVAAVRPCNFCGMPVLGAPYSPLSLIQVTARNAAAAPFSPDGMQTDEAPPETTPALENVLFRLSLPLSCCSAPCWVAEALATFGEGSRTGQFIAGRFPGLLPTTLGGEMLTRFQARAVQVRNEMFERARQNMIARGEWEMNV